MRLVEPEEVLESEFCDFVDEFEDVGERLVPYSLNRRGKDFRELTRARYKPH